jgi:N,N'-diacetyllegionaminate synthase
MGKSTYIIAEMACSHEGDPTLALKIIEAAGKASADAVQFQIFKQIERAVPSHPDFQLLGRLELTPEEWSTLADYVRSKFPTMQIVACVYERSSVDLAEKMGVDAYKIHSADLSNPHLLNYVASTGKRIDLSMGASTIEEITLAIECIRKDSPLDIWLMYGIQNFPTPVNAIHLNYMMKLKQFFELPIGYQDHSDADSEAAFWLPAAALGMGVDILEKHITHDRSYRGVDHQAALNPDEFNRFAQMVRQIDAAKGTSIPKTFTAEEMKYRRYAKKSIVAAVSLSDGQVVSEDHLKYMFAERQGLPPDQAGRLIGRTAKKQISQYKIIVESDLV